MSTPASRYQGYPTNSAWQCARAHKIRAWLFDMLGGECAECGALAPLEIDHPWGRDWKPSRLSLYKRHLRYKKEALEGRVRLLCRECNNAILPRRGGETVGEAPF
jgi:hypothetical protein